MNNLVNSQGLGLVFPKENTWKILIHRMFGNLYSSIPFRLKEISKRFAFSVKEKILFWTGLLKDTFKI